MTDAAFASFSLFGTFLLILIVWAPILGLLSLAKKASTSRRYIANTINTRALDMEGGGAAQTIDAQAHETEWSQHDDFEMYTDTEGGDGGGE